MKKRRDKIGNNQAITIKNTGIVVDLKYWNEAKF